MWKSSVSLLLFNRHTNSQVSTIFTCSKPQFVLFCKTILQPRLNWMRCFYKLASLIFMSVSRRLFSTGKKIMWCHNNLITILNCFKTDGIFSSIANTLLYWRITGAIYCCCHTAPAHSHHRRSVFYWLRFWSFKWKNDRCKIKVIFMCAIIIFSSMCAVQS